MHKIHAIINLTPIKVQRRGKPKASFGHRLAHIRLAIEPSFSLGLPKLESLFVDLHIPDEILLGLQRQHSLCISKVCVYIHY